MRFLQDMSIRRKQMLIIMVTSTTALLLACAAFITYDVTRFRKELTQRVASLAEVIGNTCTAAIDYNDVKTATDTLQALRAEPNILAACVYSRNGQVLAVYPGEGPLMLTNPPPVEIPGHRFANNRLHLFRSITQQGEELGTIYLSADLKELTDRLTRYAGIVVVVFVASLLVTVVLSSLLQRVVSEPILRLAQVARSVAIEKDYTVRATKQSGDELGMLIDGFNEMLGQIQARDAALQQSRLELEKRVEERTRELASSLSLLHATLESTADGILVADGLGKVTNFNENFVAMWRIPRAVAISGDEQRMLEVAIDQLTDPPSFLAKVMELYGHPEKESFDLLPFKDGRVFERYSKPQRIEEKCVGRVWSFRDVTERKRNEGALRESQALYHSLVEQLPTGVFRKDSGGRYVFANASFCQIVKLTADQILGRTPTELVAAMPAAPANSGLGTLTLGTQGVAHHALIMQTGERIEVEDQYPGVDGKPRFYHTVKSAVFDSEGRVVGTQGILFDITERKRAEAALAEASRLLETLLENSPDFIYFKDRQSRFFRYSRTLPEHFHLTDAEGLRGKTEFDCYAEDRARAAFDDEQEIVRTGKPIIGKLETATHADGRTTWVLTNKMPWRDRDGNIVGTFGISKDVTALKEAEARLAYERHLLRALLDSFPDHIYFKDRDSRFVQCSKSLAQLFNVSSADQLIGKTDFDFFTEEHARPAFEDEQAIIRTGQPIIGKEEKETWPDGRVTWALTSKLPLRDVQGNIIGTFGISKNVTALKKAEAELAAAQQQLLETSRQAGMAEVATNVLHNVGNVLNSVTTSAGVLMDRIRSSKVSGITRATALLEEHRADLAGFFARDGRGMQLLTYLKSLSEHLNGEQTTLLKEIQELTQNIEHIKEIVAMQQNYARVSGVVETLSVSALVEDALRMQGASLARHEVRVVRQFDPVPNIPVDKHKVLQILVNLVSNALHALTESTATERRLTVSVTPHEGRWLRVAIGDNGVGIARENLTRVFSHGFTTRSKGHGFGLHSGALAAKEMGGLLTAHSEGLGQGATFILELPIPPA